MGFHGIVVSMLRRWYISLFAVILASGVWFFLVKDGGCFTTSTVVTFTLPARATILPESGLEDSSVIAFAGVVANEINDGRPAPRYASRDAPLYGVGVRRGVIVGLPNSGGQWSSSYARAEIEIQVVGRSHEEVRARQTELLNRVFDISREQQVNTPATGRISADVLPLTAGIEEITPTRSSRLVALLALLMSAGLVAGGLSVLLDRRWPKLQHGQSDEHVTELIAT